MDPSIESRTTEQRESTRLLRPIDLATANPQVAHAFVERVSQDAIRESGEFSEILSDELMTGIPAQTVAVEAQIRERAAQTQREISNLNLDDLAKIDEAWDEPTMSSRTLVTGEEPSPSQKNPDLSGMPAMKRLPPDGALEPRPSSNEMRRDVPSIRLIEGKTIPKLLELDYIVEQILKRLESNGKIRYVADMTEPERMEFKQIAEDGLEGISDQHLQEKVLSPNIGSLVIQLKKLLNLLTQKENVSIVDEIDIQASLKAWRQWVAIEAAPSTYMDEAPPKHVEDEPPTQEIAPPESQRRVISIGEKDAPAVSARKIFDIGGEKRVEVTHETAVDAMRTKDEKRILEKQRNDLEVAEADLTNMHAEAMKPKKKELHLAKKSITELGNKAEAMYQKGDSAGLEAVIEALAATATRRSEALAAFATDHPDKDTWDDKMRIGFQIGELEEKLGHTIYLRTIAQKEALRIKQELDVTVADIWKIKTKLEFFTGTKEERAQIEKSLAQLKAFQVTQEADRTSATDQISVYEKQITSIVNTMGELEEFYASTKKMAEDQNVAEAEEPESRERAKKSGKAEAAPFKLADTLKKGEKVFDWMASLLSADTDYAKLLDAIGRKFMQWTDYGAKKDEWLRTEKKSGQAGELGTEITGAEAGWERELNESMKKRFKLEKKAAICVHKLAERKDAEATSVVEAFTTWKKSQQDTESKSYCSALEEWIQRLDSALNTSKKSSRAAEDVDGSDEKQAA